MIISIRGGHYNYSVYNAHGVQLTGVVSFDTVTREAEVVAYDGNGMLTGGTERAILEGAYATDPEGRRVE